MIEVEESAIAERFVEVTAEHERCFWLDGGGGLEWSGRRSWLGWLEPDGVSLTLRDGVVTRRAGQVEAPVGDDVFAALRAELLAAPERHWVGYLGYASRPDLSAATGPEPVPTAVWMRVDHLEEYTHAVPDAAVPPPATVRESQRPPPGSAYPQAFARVQEQLRAGNSYEVNLTYRERENRTADPVRTYLALRSLNPAPYGGYLQYADRHGRLRLLSSSPERFATIDRHRVVETKPIKGTTPRSTDPDHDRAMRERLTGDPKIVAENLMIVDLLRNDVGMVSRPGTVAVPGLMEVESYRSVHQLVSTVRGDLRDDVDTMSALGALFPAGSMTGAPKRRTMEIIEAVEESPRGVYSGAFGWIHADGRADLGVVIRSLVAWQPPTASVGPDPVWTYEWGTGGGVTVDSEMEVEYAETRWKAERLRAALDTAESGT